MCQTSLANIEAKVGRFSIGWFILAARLVRAHLDFSAFVLHGVKHNDFYCFKGETYM